MIPNAVLSAVCGVLCLLASFCVGTHEILMSPARPNYPEGRLRLRVLMFLWSGVLLYRGSEYLLAGYVGQGPAISPGQIGGCILVAAVHGTLLEDQLHRWLPARQQTYIQRMFSIAACRGWARAAVKAERKRNNGPLHPGVAPASESVAGLGSAIATLVMRETPIVEPGAGKDGLIAMGRPGLADLPGEPPLMSEDLAQALTARP